MEYCECKGLLRKTKLRVQEEHLGKVESTGGAFEANKIEVD